MWWKKEWGRKLLTLTKEQEIDILQSTCEKNKYAVKSLIEFIVQTLHMMKTKTF